MVEVVVVFLRIEVRKQAHMVMSNSKADFEEIRVFLEVWISGVTFLYVREGAQHLCIIFSSIKRCRNHCKRRSILVQCTIHVFVRCKLNHNNDEWMRAYRGSWRTYKVWNFQPQRGRQELKFDFSQYHINSFIVLRYYCNTDIIIKLGLYSSGVFIQSSINSFHNHVHSTERYGECPLVYFVQRLWTQNHITIIDYYLKWLIWNLVLVC